MRPADTFLLDVSLITPSFGRPAGMPNRRRDLRLLFSGIKADINSVS
jgi:hypothetical protein